MTLIGVEAGNVFPGRSSELEWQVFLWSPVYPSSHLRDFIRDGVTLREAEKSL